jgi:oryzin
MVTLRRLAVLLGAIPAALAAPTTQKREVVPNKYIVTLKEDVSNFDSHVSWVSDIHKRSLSRRSTAGIEQEFHIDTFNAYVGEFDETTIEEIKNNPDVSFPSKTPPCNQVR